MGRRSTYARNQFDRTPAAEGEASNRKSHPALEEAAGVAIAPGGVKITDPLGLKV